MNSTEIFFALLIITGFAGFAVHSMQKIGETETIASAKLVEKESAATCTAILNNYYAGAAARLEESVDCAQPENLLLAEPIVIETIEGKKIILQTGEHYGTRIHIQH